MVYCFMASALLVLSVIDWRTYEIPFCLNVFLFVLGVAAVVLDRGNLGSSDWDGLREWFAGGSLSGEWRQSNWRG